MISNTNSHLAAVICTCSLLLYALPSFATPVNSGNLRPVKGQISAFESYISNDPKDCQSINTGRHPIVAGNSFTSLDLSCPQGYALVKWNYDNYNVGIGVASGGYMESTAKCCRIRNRSVTPVA